MKPGDKVVCINDNNWYAVPVRCLCAGLIYTVKDVFTCDCGNVYLHLMEVDKYYKMWCPGCAVTSFTKMFFHIERLRLLEQQGNQEEVSEHGKVQMPLE